MLINIWISFLFPIVWLWFEQTYVPQLLLHETQSEQKQSSNSAALFPEHRLLPELKEETLLGCAVPRRDTAVWHSPSIQWRATGDTITATHLPTSLGNQQGWGFGAPWKCIQGFPLGLRCQMGFLLADVDHLYTSSVAVLEEKLEVFRPHLDKALSNLCWHWSWPCFVEELGLGALWASLQCRSWATTVSLLLPNDFILYFIWKMLAKWIQNFPFSQLSASDSTWLCCDQPLHPSVSPPLLLCEELPGNKRTVLTSIFKLICIFKY